MGNYTAADAVLDTLELQPEFDDFCEFQRILIALCGEEKKYFALENDSITKQQLETIADNAQHEASTKAQAILALVFGNQYAVARVLPEEQGAAQPLQSNDSLTPLPNKNFDFLLFPNPADKQVTLLYKAKDGAQQATVKIRDITGRLINTFTIQANSPYVYATDRLPGAVYFITLYDGGKPAQTHKLVLLK